MSINAQRGADFGRSYTDEIPDRFIVSVPELREKIYGSVPEEFLEDQKPRYLYQFADVASQQMADLLTSGSVYSDWPALEEYLKEILERVTPAEMKSEDLIELYVVKDGAFNAFMTPSGKMFINVGLIDYVKDEATIAGILAHELAHFYLSHSLARFVKGNQGGFKSGLFRSGRKALSQFSVANELQADSLAAEWVVRSDYSIDGLIRSFRLMKAIGEKRLLLYQDEWEIKETTHPTSDRRLQFLAKFKVKNQLVGEDFLISKDMFQELKEAVKPEILKLHLEAFEYSSCAEKALKYHIQETTNPVYVYYLMESIRRKCYFDVGLWQEDFITHRYFKILDDEKGRRKVKLDQGILDQYPLSLFIMNKKEMESTEGLFYWQDSPKFRTFEEAFIYFGKVGEYLNEPECILSNALSLSFKPELFQQYLDAYLAQDDIRYREYAKSLREGTIRSGLPNHTLTVFNNMLAIVRQGTEEITLKEDYDKELIIMRELMSKSMEGQEGRETVYLPGMKFGNLNDYRIFLELEQLTFSAFTSRGEQTQLHVLDPRYWDVMRRYGVNEIEFVNFMYYDVRKVDKTFEGYQEVCNTDFKDLLDETNRSRYLDVFISSVREKDDARMKIRYYGGEDELSYKDSGYGQVVDILNGKFSRKEEYAKKQDRIKQID